MEKDVQTLRTMMEGIEKDYPLVLKGNKTAASRLRKNLQTMRTVSLQMRKLALAVADEARRRAA